MEIAGVPEFESAILTWNTSGLSGSDQRGIEIADELSTFSSDEEVFGVADFTNFAYAFAKLVVDSDFASYIPWMIPVQHDESAPPGEH